MSPAYLQFEQTLAHHCAPSLTGIKPADLVCWKPPEQEGMKLLGYYAGALFRRGICLRVLGYSGGRMMLLIFRKRELEKCLEQPQVQDMLTQAGYPQGAEMEQLLMVLRRRLAQSGFPHEIGLFLGYPPVDVEGFQRDAGRNCKFSGLWKVYGDVEQTKQSFERFHRCRAALLRRLEQGYSLEQVFPAA